MSESPLHVGVGRKSKCAPESVLDAALGNAYCMIDSVATPLLVCLNLRSQGVGHISSKNVVWIDLRQFQQAFRYRPFHSLPRTRWSMLLVTVITVPHLL